MNKIEIQIKEQMRKSFFDLIDDTVNSKNPDYVWITNLYTEIRDRLGKYLNKNGKTYKNLQENFDIDLFHQMITMNVFDMNSMLKLVNNTFEWILRLQAPIRDIETEIVKNKILNSEPSKMISTFIKEVNICLDNMDDDMQKCLNEV